MSLSPKKSRLLTCRQLHWSERIDDLRTFVPCRYMCSTIEIYTPQATNISVDMVSTERPFKVDNKPKST